MHPDDEYVAAVDAVAVAVAVAAVAAAAAVVVGCGGGEVIGGQDLQRPAECVSTQIQCAVDAVAAAKSGSYY